MFKNKTTSPLNDPGLQGYMPKCKTGLSIRPLSFSSVYQCEVDSNWKKCLLQFSNTKWLGIFGMCRKILGIMYLCLQNHSLLVWYHFTACKIICKMLKICWFETSLCLPFKPLEVLIRAASKFCKFLEFKHTGKNI